MLWVDERFDVCVKCPLHRSPFSPVYLTKLAVMFYGKISHDFLIGDFSLPREDHQKTRSYSVPERPFIVLLDLHQTFVLLPAALVYLRITKPQSIPKRLASFSGPSTILSLVFWNSLYFWIDSTLLQTERTAPVRTLYFSRLAPK